MPLKSFQSNYWNLSDTTVPPLRITQGGYPAWQAAVVGSLWGAWYAWLQDGIAKVRWLARLVRRVRTLDVDRQALVLRTLDLVEHPAWSAAQQAVRETAQTLGFADPKAWVEYGRMLKRDQGRAENVFRHVRACELTRQYASSTLTNPTVNGIVELAYQSFALKGR